jgi:hypothetical protein
MTDEPPLEDAPASPREPHAAELLTLIRLDYEQSLQFIDGVTRISSTIRQTAATAGVALIGLTIQDKSPALGVAGAVLGIVLGLMDAYHGSLYSQTRDAAIAAERVFRQAKQHFERPYDDAVRRRLDEMVEDYDTGVVVRLSPPSLSGLTRARPRVMYLTYVGVILGGLAAANWCK